MELHLPPLLVLLLAAALAPLVAELPLRVRPPLVVLELLFGICIGPQVLGWVEATPFVARLAEIGMAFLFFLAGMELDLDELRGRPIALASGGWLLSLALAGAAALLLAAAEVVDAPLLVAIALTTTAIGTLLPILRDAGELGTPFGRQILAAGAVGEFGPIVLVAVLLSQRASSAFQAAVLLGFVAVAMLTALAWLRLRTPAVVRLLSRTLQTSSQLPVRLCMLLLAAFSVAADELGLDLVLGAFAAGIVVGLATRDAEGYPLHAKLDALGFGFLIPIFFVMSGVRFDLAALLASPASAARVPLFLALFLLVRGLPALLLHRRELAARDRAALGLYSATALPLVVAITEIGVGTGVMRRDNASALVGAGMLSVLLFPVLALALRRGARREGDA